MLLLTQNLLSKLLVRCEADPAATDTAATAGVLEPYPDAADFFLAGGSSPSSGIFLGQP